VKLVALACVLIATSVFAQPRPLSLCIVQTKTDARSQYEPSAGPYAAAMYDQLANQRLRNGSALHITVLAASIQRDILAEVHRLNCFWVVQLWFEGGTHQAMADQNSLYFSLWNSDTRKVIARGSRATVRETHGDGSLVPNFTVYSEIARQILKKLNQLP
jgi:hypothetical protein